MDTVGMNTLKRPRLVGFHRFWVLWAAWLVASCNSGGGETGAPHDAGGRTNASQPLEAGASSDKGPRTEDKVDRDASVPLDGATDPSVTSRDETGSTNSNGGTSAPSSSAGDDTSTSANRAPTAKAGSAQKVDVGEAVTLDASGSSDPDGDELEYAWKVIKQPQGAKVKLSDSKAPKPTFTVPQDGNYVFELTVNDGELASEPDTVLVTTTDNRAPTANASADVAAKIGDEITLDGTGSLDPDGDGITFAWTLQAPKTSKAKLSDATAAKPTFEVDVAGDYVVTLVVNDGALDSESDDVTVSTNNLPPVADIADVSGPILVGSAASLDGSGSTDANGDALSYKWSFTYKPPRSIAVLEDANQEVASLVPDVRGDYIVQLIVNDGAVDSQPVTVVLSPENRKPIADAGTDRALSVGASVVLNGDGSSDPDNDELSYGWVFVSRPEGSNATLAAANTAAPSFTPDVAGAYQIALTVNDGELSSEADAVTITATTPNSSVPIIEEFTPTAGPAGTLVTVTGSGFTGEGGVHVFVTTASGAMEAAVVSATDTEVQFVLPPGTVSGTITVQVGEHTAQSSTPLTVEVSSSFDLEVMPSVLPLNPGVSVATIVRLGTTSGFADLADLSIENLPTGITATFKPQKIRAGDWSLLTLQAADDQGPSEVNLTVKASATIDGEVRSELGQVEVTVLPTTTAFVGRTVVDDPRQTPLAGVTVTLLGKDGNAGSTNCSGTTVSDAAGNFAFTNLPAGCTNTQLVRYDGATVVTPAGEYASADLASEIVSGTATEPGTLVHLPRIDDAPRVLVTQNAVTDQVFTFPGIPHLEVTIYAGTTLTMPDGTTPNPFPMVVVPIPVDRLPEPVPQTQPGFHFFMVAFQPARAVASQPIAVSYPNQMGFPAGTSMPLLTLDPELGVIVEYGTGTVGDDELMIVPDLDPSRPGKRFGIVHLDWHLPWSVNEPTSRRSTGGAGTGCPVELGGKVDLASGLEVHERTDIGLSGGRGSVGVTRSYRSGDSNVGPFGRGGTHNYHYQISVQSLTAKTFNFVPPNGNFVSFVRQADGTYTNITDPSVAGAVFRAVSGGSELRMLDGTVLGFSPFPTMGGSMLTSITDPNGNKVTIARSGSVPRGITSVTDPVGRQLTFTSDSSGRVTRITDPIGRQVSYTYDSAGYLSTATDVLGKVTKYAYTTKGELRSITDFRDIEVQSLTYDVAGRVSSETLLGFGTTNFAYTVINQAMPKSPVIETRVTDPQGRIATYRFNPQGYLLSATDPLGQTNTLHRESGTNRILETTGSGSCGTCGSTGAGYGRYTYNAAGQTLSQTDEVGATSEFQYEAVFGRPTQVKDALGDITQLDYDLKGNLTRITDALAHSSALEYNVNGQVTAAIDVDGKRTELTYDAAGNVVSVKDPVGNVSRMRYDAVSRLVEVTDTLGRRATTRYDAANRVTESVDPAGGITKFTYDELGNLATLTDPRGAVTKYEYDQVGRLVKRIDPMNAAEAYSYDGFGRLLQTTDRRGLNTSYTYDGVDRLAQVTYADAAVDYSYDAEGNVATIQDSASGEYRFAYDVRNLLAGIQGPGGAISYARDALGRVSRETVLGQPETFYSYNAAGQYTRIETEGAGIDYAFDASGRLSSETRDNGVTTHYTYDTRGAVSGVSHELGGSELDMQSYEHDAAGSTTYAEDSLLEPLGTEEVTASYDLANRIQSWGNKTFAHDAEGNRVSVSEDGQTEDYTWDARGRLTSIRQADGSLLQLSYDFAGNLSRVSGPGGDETQLTGASGNVVMRRTRGGTLQRMLNGLSMDHQVALLDSAHGVRYPLLTRPNSTIATVDGSGNIDGQYSYEPYGETSVTKAAAADYPFLFTGRTRVTDGLYYYRARFYDPVTSRFVSEDPLGFGGGDLNLYGYVGGKVLDASDPSGKDTKYLGIEVGASIGAGTTLGVGLSYDTDNWLNSGLYFAGPPRGHVLNTVGLGWKLAFTGGATIKTDATLTASTGVELGVWGFDLVYAFDGSRPGGIGAAWTLGPQAGFVRSISRTRTLSLQDMSDWVNHRNSNTPEQIGYGSGQTCPPHAPVGWDWEALGRASRQF